MMVARKPIPFERVGEDPIQVEVADGEKAITRATAMILMHARLYPGDRLKVDAIE
jgi:hypothetical protein